jgi:hypothetical protein
MEQITSAGQNGRVADEWGGLTMLSGQDEEVSQSIDDTEGHLYSATAWMVGAFVWMDERMNEIRQGPCPTGQCPYW